MKTVANVLASRIGRLKLVVSITEKNYKNNLMASQMCYDKNLQHKKVKLSTLLQLQKDLKEKQLI